MQKLTATICLLRTKYVNLLSMFRTILGAHSKLLHVAMDSRSYVEGHTGVYKIAESRHPPGKKGGHATVQPSDNLENIM
jgi:hypothetical protein